MNCSRTFAEIDRKLMLIEDSRLKRSLWEVVERDFEATRDDKEEMG